MLRKLFGMMVLLIFALSIIQVMADEDIEVSVDGSTNLDIESDTNVESDDDSTEGSANANARSDANVNMRDRVKENREKARNLIEERRMKAQERAGNAQERGVHSDFIRAKAQVRMEVNQALANYHRAKAHFLEVRSEHQKNKMRILELRDEVRDCKESQSEDCKEKREELRSGLRMHLEKTLGVMQESTTQLEAKINASESLSIEQRAASLGTLAELNADIAAEMSFVETLNSNSSKEDYDTAIKETKELWDKVRIEEKKIIALFVSSKLDLIIDKDNEYLASMQKRIDTLKNQGIDTSELEEIRAQFQAQVTASAATIEQAQAKISASQTGKDLNVAWKEVHSEVRDDLKETKEYLKDFIKTSRELHAESDVNSSVAANTETTAAIEQ